MTSADRIALLEAELELARRDADNERSTREALDRWAQEVRELLRARVRRLRIRPGEAAVIETEKYLTPEQRSRAAQAWKAIFPGTTLVVLDQGLTLTSVVVPAREDPS